MRSIMKWLCGMCCVLVTLLVNQPAQACGRCGHNPCRLRPIHQLRPVQAQQVAPVHTDRSFNVTYHVTFPPPAVAGATGFAYSPAQYSFLDPALFVNAASRYLETGQLAAKQGFSEFNQSAALVIGQQANVAELQARSALLDQAAKLLSATAPGGSVQLQLRASRDQEGRIHIESSRLPTASRKVTDIVAAKCVRCHGPNRKEADLDLSNLDVLDRSYEAKILDRITTADPSKRMPQGGTLSAEEIAAFFRTSSLCGGQKP